MTELKVTSATNLMYYELISLFKETLLFYSKDILIMFWQNPHKPFDKLV